MAESISNKNADRSYIRELQQDKNARKKELAEQQREETKQLKQFYAEKNKDIDNETADAINHIKMDQSSADGEDRQAKIEDRKAQLEEKKLEAEQKAEDRRNGVSQASVYNREGRLATSTEKKSLKSAQTSDSDSFYKVLDRGSQFDEAHDGYFIKAFAPEKEKDDLHVSILNDKAVISGKRKFQDTATDEKKTVSTNNFQTYREEFKFDRPVEAHGMTRERDGDYVRFFIPKLGAEKLDSEA